MPESVVGQIVLALGLESEQVSALVRSGAKVETCADVYGAAARIASKPDVSGVCLGAAALGGAGERLIAALARRGGIATWIAPGVSPRRAAGAIACGAKRWDDGRANSVADVSPAQRASDAARAVPPAATTVEAPRVEQGPRVESSPRVERAPRVEPARPAAEPAKQESQRAADLPIVRMPPRATVDDGSDGAGPRVERETPARRAAPSASVPKHVAPPAEAAQPLADNARKHHSKQSSIEGEILARYDELTREPLLSDDELNALLGDLPEGTSDSAAGP